MSEALRLADALGIVSVGGPLTVTMHEAAAELRRLHAENEALKAELLEQARVNGMGGEREARLMALNTELVEALQGMIDCCPETRGTHNPHLAMARAALAKVEASK